MLRHIPVFLVTVLLLPLASTAQNTKPESVSDIQQLIRQLRDDDLGIRETAFAEWCERVTADDLAGLHGALREHPAGRVRSRVARLIGLVGSHDSLKSLARALGDDQASQVRLAAARALADLGSTDASTPLAKAMIGDEEPNVRKRAAASLQLIQRDKARQAIRGALDAERDAGVRLTLRWLSEEQQWKADARPRLQPGQVSQGSHHGTRYRIYVPKSYDPRKTYPLLVSVHGTDGSPDDYVEMCRQDADRYDLVVLAPWFDYPTFGNFDNLNCGPRETRSDLRLLSIIDDLSEQMKLRSERLWLFGHSRGGQFVQRFVLAHPQRVERAAACGSGLYVHADPNLIFPFGVKPNPFAPDLGSVDFAALVQTPLAIVVGGADLKRRRDEAAQFMREVRQYAARTKTPRKVQFFNVPGGGHSGRSNYPTASKFLLAPLSPTR